MLHLTLHVHAQYETENSYLATVMDGMFITLPAALDVKLCLMTNGHLCMLNKHYIQWNVQTGVFMLCSSMMKSKLKETVY